MPYDGWRMEGRNTCIAESRKFIEETAYKWNEIDTPHIEVGIMLMKYSLGIEADILSVPER